ncbi:hypothetical protein [Actinomadura sp. 6N118]|uniref:hypothetical protein n=1 Tax=Actinomadura sp. 6N118 TaxID=3375151 RepID=UPI0037A65C0B
MGFSLATEPAVADPAVTEPARFAIRELPTEGATTVSPQAINEFGQIVGTAPPVGKAIRWDPDRSGNGYTPTVLVQDATSAVETVEINNRGQVLGRHNSRPTLWNRQGETTHLTPSVGPGGGIDLNDRGQALVYHEMMLFPFRAGVWSGGTFTEISEPGKSAAIGRAINNRGQATGTYLALSGPEPTEFGFVWDKGTMTRVLGPGGRLAFTFDINDRGQVIGWTSDADERFFPFVWERGRMTELATLGSSFNFPAWHRSINNRGQIIGVSGTTSEGSLPVMWDRGRLIELGTLGGTKASVTAINNRGQVVGWSETADGEEHAFLWERGRMTDLGTLGGKSSQATDINDRGQVIGVSRNEAGANRAVVWTPRR